MENKHYGIKLKEYLKQNGVSKIWASKKIGLSRVWLDKMIKTGKFNPEKLKKVKLILKEK